METSRFFVAQLPLKTQESDLRQLFEDYGPVERVELKVKENLVDPTDVKRIAFVTLKIGKNDAQYCVNDLNWQKVHGERIKVTLAKESFLERLKREREEAELAKTGAKPEQQIESTSELLTQTSAQNKRKTFSEDADLNDDDDIAPELLITKKRAATSLHNGRIVIQSYDTTPVHVIEPKKSEKILDSKGATADQKRKESLKKLKQQYDQQKNAIQKALTGANGVASNKIKFSDAESDDETDKLPKSGTKLFDGSDDEGDDDQFSFKPQLSGKKGERLMQMQSKQSLDPRFKIDAKFVDDDEYDEDEHEVEVDNDDERKWQMGILEQVVGTKIDTTNNQQKSNKKKMLRYDPAKDEHRKFERQKNNQKFTDKADKYEVTNQIPKPAEVSKEVFYVVKDTLAQSLKAPSEGFSLLNMFGNSHDELENREDHLKKISNEKILINKTDNQQLNPFKYDSSSDSEEENEINNSTTNKATTETTSKKGAKKGKLKIVLESFFIPKNDERLKEGAKFFKFNRDAEQNYDEVRDRLKMLIKSKIAKSKKNQNVGSVKKRRNKK